MALTARAGRSSGPSKRLVFAPRAVQALLAWTYLDQPDGEFDAAYGETDARAAASTRPSTKSGAMRSTWRSNVSL